MLMDIIYRLTVHSIHCSFLDLVGLKRPKKTEEQDEKKKMPGRFVTSLLPGCCIDFHSIVSWSLWSSSSICVSPAFTMYTAPAGIQHLSDWHTVWTHPQVLSLQQSAFTGHLPKTLCKWWMVMDAYATCNQIKILKSITKSTSTWLNNSLFISVMNR